ncbi:DUF305 domain-containing protein [Streptomyces uncialis]|uniref:DUF305 domain-containing protein n=1 Tax=Streptomyces uncialis TaxID=1048205 RepID=UPI003864BB4E
MRRPGPFVSAALAAAAVLAALTVATAASSGPAPAPPPAATAPADGSADAGFARDMAVHHQQAVEMAYLVRDRTGDEDIRVLAYDIAQTQSTQRGMLLGWLDLWELPTVSAREPMAWMGMTPDPRDVRDGALMPGMATRAQLDELRAARGRTAEALFLRLMTDHHRGGVHMAEGCVRSCAVPVGKRLARGMVDGQRSEIARMDELLRARAGG